MSIQASHSNRPVTDAAKQSGLVADGQQAHLLPADEVEDDVPDLRLRDRIEHGGHLVGDQIACLWPKGTGHSDTLQLAATQLVGPARQPAGLDAERRQQFSGSLAALGQRAGDAPARVERKLRVLEDELYRTEPVFVLLYSESDTMRLFRDNVTL